MGMPTITTSGVSRCEAITDIIQSVALQQAALAHILNAEGEKIQRVVAESGASVSEMLETNKSVNDMIFSITNLETVLRLKLELFKDCLCACEEETKEDIEEVSAE